MLDSFITMPRVYNRKMRLETCFRGQRPNKDKIAYRLVKENLNVNTLTNFITETFQNKYSVNEYFNEILNMIEQVDASETQKENLVKWVKTNYIPYLTSEAVDSANRFVSVHGMIPASDTIETVLRDLSVMDRILKNDKALRNRFDLDKIIQNNSSGDVEDIVKELCELIDTYTLSREAKLNIALENIQYSLYKNGIRDVDHEKLVSAITEYFLTNTPVITDEEYRGIKKVLRNNCTISESCMNTIGYIFENSHITFAKRIDELAAKCEDPEVKAIIITSKKISNEKMAATYITKALGKSNMISTEPSDRKNLMISIHSIPLMGKVSKSFVLSQVKLAEMKLAKQNEEEDKEFISIMKTLYDDAESLVENAEVLEAYAPIKEDEFGSLYKDPTLLDFLESQDFADSKDIKKVLDDFKADQDKSLSRFKRCMNRIYTKSPENIIDETPHILSAIRVTFIVGSFAIPVIGPVLAVVLYFVDKLISMGINDNQSKKLITRLKDERKLVKEKIEKAKDADEKKRLEEYEACLKKCIEKVQSYRDNEFGEEDDDADDLNDTDDFGGDDDLDFSFEAKLCLKMDVLNTIMEARQSISEEDIHSLVETCLKNKCFPELVELMNEASDVFDIPGIISYYKPKKYISLGIHESSNLTAGEDRFKKLPVFTDEDSIYPSHYYTECLAIQEINNLIAMNEKVNLNTLKLAIQNFKKKAKDLSTKEKSMWQSLDATMSGFMKAIEKSMTSDRREAIIKGSIIPSFSKCIKIGLTVAGATFINPIFGLITALGIYGTSKKLNDRERQLIFDEIETELKVVDKQIQMADNDGDMKQYRFLLQYQKKLERERQRIKYGLKVHGRDIPSSSAGRREV